MTRGLSIIITFIIFISACKKDKNSPALLLITPDVNYFDVQTSDILRFDISGSSELSPLKSFSITGKAGNAFSTAVFDTSFSSKYFNMSYEYQVPDVSQNTGITLEFILNDDAGNQTRIAKILNVTATNTYPAETTGNEMFSSLSGKQDAYDLSTLQPLFSQSSADSSEHIKDATVNDSTGANNTLSKKWISTAGLNFVRFSDFDYANATYNNIRDAYEAGIKKDFIDNLTDGDIILTRFLNSDANKGYMAIRLVYVIDADSTDMDRYIFNVKK